MSGSGTGGDSGGFMGKNMETWEGERVCRMLKRRGLGGLEMLLDSGNVALRGDEWVCMGASGLWLMILDSSCVIRCGNVRI